MRCRSRPRSGRSSGRGPHADRRCRRRPHEPGHRRPPPLLGPGARRLSVADRRARRRSRRFGPDDLAPLLPPTGSTGRSSSRPASSLEETREFLATAAATPFIAGVVGWVDLTDPASRRRARALRDGPGGRAPRRDPPPGPRRAGPGLAAARRRRGAGSRRSGAAGLVYDLLVRPRELPAAPTSPGRCRTSASSSTTSPSRRSRRARSSPGPRDPRRSVSSNVCVQALRAGHRGRLGRWRRRPAPFVDLALELRAARLMFGSDWPVCLLAATYERGRRRRPEALAGLRTTSEPPSSADGGRSTACAYRGLSSRSERVGHSRRRASGGRRGAPAPARPSPGP